MTSKMLLRGKTRIRLNRLAKLFERTQRRDRVLVAAGIPASDTRRSLNYDRAMRITRAIRDTVCRPWAHH